MTRFHAIYTTSKKPVHVLRILVSRAEISPDINWHCRHAVERAIKPVHTLLVQSTGTCCRWLYYDDPDIPTDRPSDVYRSRRPCGRVDIVKISTSVISRWMAAVDRANWRPNGLLCAPAAAVIGAIGASHRYVIVHLDTTSCWCCCYSSLEPIQCDINANQDRTPCTTFTNASCWWLAPCKSVRFVSHVMMLCLPPSMLSQKW